MDSNPPKNLRILVHLDGTLRRVVPISTQEVRIGRGSENDLVLEDQKVSRYHCRIFSQDGQLCIEDQKSSNGTYVNGRQIKRLTLNTDEEIDIGAFRLTVEVTPDAELVELPIGSVPTLQPSPGGPARNESLNLLLSILESFDVEAGREQLLEKILDGLLDALHAERAMLWRHDSRRSKVHRIYMHCRKGARADLPTSTTLVLKVATEREPCLINGVFETPGVEVPSIGRLGKESVQSIVISPLLLGRRLAGILYVDSRAARRSFTSNDLDLLSRTSRYLAGLVDSIEAREELSQANSRLLEIVKDRGREEVPLDRLHAPGSPFGSCLELVRKAAPRDVTVLLTGETGTGKEEVARLIHRSSARAGGPFIAINCGAIPETLVESELFGHMKGAFSGAAENRPGLVELAQGGTLFLDEVGELPSHVQVKLLRVLSERQVTRVGSGDPIEVDFRLVAATHRNLAQQVTQGTFREDLFYRLKVFPVELPPLRDRSMDLPLLVDYLLARLGARMGSKVRTSEKGLVSALVDYRWPGNIRELRNALERALIVEDSDQLSIASLPPEVLARGPQSQQLATGHAKPDQPRSDDRLRPRPYRDELKDFDKNYLERLRAATGSNISQMARIAAMSRPTLYRKMEELSLVIPSSKDDSDE